LGDPVKPAIAVGFASALAISSPAASAQKPVREGATSVLYKQPPTTLSGLAAASDRVVVVRVISSRGIESVQPGGAVLTEIKATIIDVVKPNPQVGPAGSSVTFDLRGGEIDRGDYIERVFDQAQPRLVNGHEYVVALTWSRSENAFYSAFGPGSIFEVSGDKVTSQRHTMLADHTKGLNKQQFIAELKKQDPASR
jgi:hypothetical protein